MNWMGRSETRSALFLCGENGKKRDVGWLSEEDRAEI